MSLFQDIRGALTVQALTATGIPADPNRAYEGKPFTSTVGTPYIAFTLIPASERPASMGPDGFTLRSGLFQVGVFYPDGFGTGAAESLADAVKDKFVPGTVVTQGTTKVRIKYAERKQAVTMPDFVQIPVTIGWEAHTPTTP